VCLFSCGLHFISFSFCFHLKNIIYFYAMYECTAYIYIHVYIYTYIHIIYIYIYISQEYLVAVELCRPEEG
jgi:hypothetical protein